MKFKDINYKYLNKEMNEEKIYDNKPVSNNILDLQNKLKEICLNYTRDNTTDLSEIRRVIPNSIWTWSIINRVKLFSRELNIDFTVVNPKKWWTYQIGKPYLYNTTSSITSTSKESFTINKKLGFRTIELVKEKDEVGQSFYFKLNGTPG